jgi:CRP-like cAMP-binding protein
MAPGLRKAEKIELLGRLMLFESFNKRDLGKIASIVVEAARPAGAYLTREGHDGGLMFVLVEGTADVISGEGGQVLGHLGRGDVVGELSLIDGQARSATVVATTSVVVLQIIRDDFQELVQRSPQFVKALLRSLSLRVRQLDHLAG